MSCRLIRTSAVSPRAFFSEDVRLGMFELRSILYLIKCSLFVGWIFAVAHGVQQLSGAGIDWIVGKIELFIIVSAGIMKLTPLTRTLWPPPVFQLTIPPTARPSSAWFSLNTGPPLFPGFITVSVCQRSGPWLLIRPPEMLKSWFKGKPNRYKDAPIGASSGSPITGIGHREPATPCTGAASSRSARSYCASR